MRVIVPVLTLVLAGCIDLEEEYTINPDGSGKVVVQWAHAPFDLSGERSPDESMKKAVREELEQSEGVDAWKDVSWQLRDDGKVGFKGTAYFKDLSKLRLHTQGMNLVRLAHAKEATGALAVTVDLGSEPSGEKKPEKLSDEEIGKRMKVERAKYQQSRPLMEPMLKDMRARIKVNLPGAIGAVGCFKKASEAAAELTLEGKTLLKVIDEAVMDDAWLEKQIKERGDFSKGGPDDALYQKMFGEKGPIRLATTGALKPAFDYEAEAGPARKQLADVLAKVGGRGPAAPPSKGGGFKELKVAGVQLVYAADQERGVAPFSGGGRGMTISLVGELPGSVLNVKEGRIDTAVSDDGEDLLPRDKWARTIQFPKLTTDKTGVVFEAKIKLPGEKARGIKELAGTLEYVVGEKTKEVDLGFGELKPGESGKAFGATIAKLEDSPWQQGHQQLELKIEGSADLVESVSFYDESGVKLKVDAGGHWSMGDATSFTFTIKGKFPAKGRVVMNVYEDLKTYEIQFSVKDIDLLGRPVK